MSNFLDIGKTGTFALWFWGIFGLFFGVLSLIEGSFAVGIFMIATAIIAFYELQKRKHTSKERKEIDEMDQKFVKNLNENMDKEDKTISYLNSKVWYRFVKVVYILSFIIILLGYNLI